MNSFTLFDRNTTAIVDRGAVSALMSGANNCVTITGLEEETTENNGILFYPNPFTSSIDLRLDHPEQVNRLVVSDMLGNTVETVESGAILSNVSFGSALKTGLYTVQVYGNSQTRSFKIIKK